MSDESDEVEETEAATDAADDEVTDAETEEQAVDEEAADESADGLQDGDFIRLAYTARTVEDDQLVDTTDEEVAEEEGVADQGTFEPRVVVLGEGHIFPGVEDDIRGKEVGDEGSVTVPAGEAFGEYDEEQVRTVSADKIDEDDRYPGARVQIDGEQGVLETIVGGRARVDFNHPLAGEDIIYEYEILEVVEDDVEKAEGLLGMFLDLDLEMWVQTDEVEETRVEEPDEDADADGDSETSEDEPAEPETVTETVEKRTLYVESTPQLAMNQQWMMQKQQIAQQLVELTDIDRILIQEILDGGGMGMGMGGMMGGMGGGAGDVDLEEALEEADIDADEIADEL
jgi:FKBP-type peptidyl-prolyl cis-trans isomerase SlyD